MKTTLKITMCAAALCVAGQASADSVGEFVKNALRGHINGPADLKSLNTDEERMDACVALMAFVGQQAAYGSHAPTIDLIQECVSRMRVGAWGP